MSLQTEQLCAYCGHRITRSALRLTRRLFSSLPAMTIFYCNDDCLTLDLANKRAKALDLAQRVEKSGGVLKPLTDSLQGRPRPPRRLRRYVEMKERFK